MNRGPDENFYDAQAGAFRDGGFAALRDLGAEYVDEPKLLAYPSPIRWLWIALLARCAPIARVSAVLLVGAAVALAIGYGASPLLAFPLVVCSPLRRMLSTGKLQDTTTALATVLCLLAAQAGSPALALALAVLLALKEASVFCLPAIAAAWLIGRHDALELGAVVLVGIGLWLASLGLIFGKNAFAMLKAGRAGHATPYTLEHQRGAPHRLFVDLATISPVAVVLAIIGIQTAPALAGATMALLAAHAVAPVRNVRLVLAAELLVRCLAAIAIAKQPVSIGIPLLGLSLATDVALGRRLKDIYDPVTSALTAALGMTKA